MRDNFIFTFNSLKSQFELALDLGYKVITCDNYIQNKKSFINEKIIINRIDLDLSIKKADRLVRIFNDLDIEGSFFLRLHAPEYNPFSFENYKILKNLILSGHELGYHSEIVDQSAIWDEKIIDCLKRDIRIINEMFNINIRGVASHNGMTGLNNLDFWRKNMPGYFGLSYEAYDWFNDAFYISDSEISQWKCYDKGKLMKGDNRTFGEHLMNNHQIIYLLTHPDTYYDRHPYDQ
ncbi:MAG: hypothetical protein CMJ38_00305 [Phycisphaerae bacterium]|nr:hypothetical protein [Phycisphaerae bacterium]